MATIVIVLKTAEGGLWSVPHARELRSRGHDVCFLLPTGGGRLSAAARDEHFIVREIPFDFSFKRPARFLKGLAKVRREIKRLEADVVFYHLLASAIVSRLATFGMAIRRVHMVAGPVYLESRIIRAFESLLTLFDDQIIAGSEYTYREYLRLPLVNSARLSMVPYGVDVSSRVAVDERRRADARSRLGLSSDCFVAVMVSYFYAPKSLVGHSRGLKGHEDLLAAWRSFVNAHPNCVLLLVGSGFDEAGELYRESVRELYDADGVRWIDSVTDVSDYYYSSDVSVSPSLSENHGAAMEAGAYGLPSIVSNAGGLPEMVDSGSGWVVPAASPDQLEAALEEAHRAFANGSTFSMGQRARRHIAEAYSHSVVVPRVADKVCESSSRRKCLIVTEAHFSRDKSGRWFSMDGVNGDQQWSRYLATGHSLEVAARARCAGTVFDRHSDPLTVASLRPLRDYTGVRELLLCLPFLTLGLWRAVRETNLAILRLPGPLSILAGILLRVTSRPYAVEVVGDLDALLVNQRSMSGWAVRRLSVTLTRWIVRDANAARYVTRTSLQSAFPTRTDRSVGISNVQVSEQDFVSGPRLERAFENGPILLAVGTHSASYKGHQYAIRALPILQKRYPSSRLVLVGSGEYQPVLRELASSLGLDSSIEFAGQLTRKQVQAEMDRADVLVQPSITEGLPRVVIEAYARGLPAVGSRVAGIPELLPQDLLFEVGDIDGLASAVFRCLLNDAIYSSYSFSALSLASEYRKDKLDLSFAQWFGWVSEL